MSPYDIYGYLFLARWHDRRDRSLVLTTESTKSKLNSSRLSILWSSWLSNYG